MPAETKNPKPFVIPEELYPALQRAAEKKAARSQGLQLYVTPQLLAKALEDEVERFLAAKNHLPKLPIEGGDLVHAKQEHPKAFMKSVKKAAKPTRDQYQQYGVVQWAKQIVETKPEHFLAMLQKMHVRPFQEELEAYLAQNPAPSGNPSVIQKTVEICLDYYLKCEQASQVTHPASGGELLKQLNREILDDEGSKQWGIIRAGRIVRSCEMKRMPAHGGMEPKSKESVRDFRIRLLETILSPAEIGAAKY